MIRRVFNRNLSPLHLVFLGAITILSFLLILAYNRPGQLGVYDTAGHVLAVHNLAATWPQVFTWHANTLLGLVYGNLYPPLFHWLIAGLATLIGTSAAFTAVVCSAIIATPIALWYYASQLCTQVHRRMIVTALALGVLLALPGYLGVGYSGLFQLGLVTSFLATPLVISAWALTEKVATSRQKRLALVLGVVGGVLCWSHIVATIAAAAYVLAALMKAAILRQRAMVARYSIALGTALLLASPFIIKFLRSYHSSIGQLSSISSSLMYAAFTVALAVAAWWMVRRQNVTLSGVPLALLTGSVLGIVCVADALLTRASAGHSLLYSLSVYRLQPYALLLLAVGLLQLTLQYQPLRRLVPNYTRAVRYTVLAATCCLLVIAAAKSPLSQTQTTVSDVQASAVSGRYIEQFSRSDSLLAPYALQTQLAMQNNAAQWAYGVFIESEPNAPFLKSLSMSLRPSTGAPQPTVHLPEDVTVSPERHQALLRHFGISTMISLNDNPVGAIATWRHGKKQQYYHTATQPQVLAEVPSLPLRPITSQWEASVLDWWQTSGPLTDIPYNAARGKVSGSTKPVPVGIRQWGPRSIVLHIDAPTPTVVLVKAPFHSAWVATDSTGQTLPLYQAAPNLLLVSGKGTITLTIHQ
ncbi:MAG: hypothetical protein WAQ25_03335 [Candidatus Saccharimonas sp.]